MHGGLTREASITSGFSSMANVGVEKTQSVHITNRECLKGAFMDLEKEGRISFMPSWRKVILLYTFDIKKLDSASKGKIGHL